MGGFHKVENYLPVGEVDGSLAELLVKRGVVQHIEILEHEQPGSLVVGIERNETAEIVQGLLVHRLGMFDQLR